MNLREEILKNSGLLLEMPVRQSKYMNVLLEIRNDNDVMSFEVDNTKEMLNLDGTVCLKNQKNHVLNWLKGIDEIIPIGEKDDIELIKHPKNISLTIYDFDLEDDSDTISVPKEMWSLIINKVLQAIKNKGK